MRLRFLLIGATVLSIMAVGRRGGTWNNGYAVVKTATSNPAGQLPELLMTIWPDEFESASSARRACRRSIVLVDGSVGRNGQQVSTGSQVELLARVSSPAPSGGRRGPPPARADPLQVVFEDGSFAVVYKPAGMPTAGGDSSRTSMRELLVTSMSCDGAPEGDAPLWRPQHVHRLDAGTSGLLVVAKTRGALTGLSAAFAQRAVRKTYRAVVAGDPAPGAASGLASALRRVDLPLSGQEAMTEWRLISRHASARWGFVCIVECFPHTGRTHQIRRHLAALGSPIVGDAKYWLPALEEHRGTRLFLCAVGLRLPHPATGAVLEIACDQPPEFDAYCASTAGTGSGAAGAASEAAEVASASASWAGGVGREADGSTDDAGTEAEWAEVAE
jgi:RluA family pseudouridine synthase